MLSMKTPSSKRILCTHSDCVHAYGKHQQPRESFEQSPALPLENKLYGSVDSFMQGYYGFRKFLTTPTPFPLIQMAKTFLFLYAFAIPFVLLKENSGLVAHCFFVFLVTMGFVRLEAVATELDNPFGDDPNDFK